MMEQEYQYMVVTRCFTFNHAPYIVDAMNGFTMQETTFPVITCIVDDASTDGEPEVIKQYLTDHFQAPYRIDETDDYHLICAVHKTNPNCTFVVFLLKYNHYSIKKPKLPYLSEWLDNAKYIALCEGDDYWIHPKKLQMQATNLESHEDFSMCFHPNYNLYTSGDTKIHQPPVKKDQYSAIDVIAGGGGFITTNSFFFRNKYLYEEGYPDFYKHCPIGDAPLMLYLAAKGNIGYIDEFCSVYRVATPGSWTSRQTTFSIRKKHHQAITKMFDEYDEYTDYKYHRAIIQKKRFNNKAFTKFAIQYFFKKFLTQMGLLK